jgi:thymidylate synthase
MVKKLAEAPHTRRAQSITWKVWEDNECYDPPCLQSIWCRIIEEEGVPVISMNVRFRSNDAYKAAFMNIFALVQLQKQIAESVSSKIGRQVTLGRYCHLADSYHIYGSYFGEFERRFLGALEKRTFEQRTLRYEDFREMMETARPGILEKARAMAR